MSPNISSPSIPPASQLVDARVPYWITSALPYINGIKHLGNLAGSMLPADAYARYCRMLGRDTLYVCATDAHGTPAELSAQSAGMDVATYCEKMHGIHANLCAAFGLSFDVFSTTSSQINHQLTQDFYHQLDQNGWLEERDSLQAYDPVAKRFLPDRYAMGTCPHCQYPKAGGDQCDSCGRLLDPQDLIDLRSRLDPDVALELRTTRHLYLRQSAMSGMLNRWLESHSFGTYVDSTARKWLNEGLADRSITRDLAWGIPVAYKGKLRAGFEGKVFYVWFDAPIGYISSAIEWAQMRHEPDSWKRFCLVGGHLVGGHGGERNQDEAGSLQEPAGSAQEPASSHHVQFMGKDNVAFHTLSFPATLLGSMMPSQMGSEPAQHLDAWKKAGAWKMADRIKAFQWVSYAGGKFSTSQQRGIFMDQAIELYPADWWRWYLLSQAPESHDLDFSWAHFQSIINKDLADVLGNHVSRVVKFAHSKYGGTLPATPPASWQYPGRTQMIETVDALIQEHLVAMEAIRLRKAAGSLRALWVVANEWMQRSAPWALIKTDPEGARHLVHDGLCAIVLHAHLSAPFVPGLSRKMLSLFDHPLSSRPVPAAGDTLDYPYLSGNLSPNQLHPNQAEQQPSQVALPWHTPMALTTWGQASEWLIQCGGALGQLESSLVPKITDDEVATHIARFGST